MRIISIACVIWSMLFVATLCGQTAPATSSQPSTAPATTPASRPMTATMDFNFESTPIETILDEMSARLGLIIERPFSIKQKVTVRGFPHPVDADEAITLLNCILYSFEYGVTELPAQKQPDGRTARVLRLTSLPMRA
jgi:hypothetical protein